MGTQRGFARIGFELLVIFLGVTAAFFAEDAVERRRERAHGESIARALAVELRDYATFGRLYSEMLNDSLATHADAGAAGAYLPPYTPRIEGSWTPPTGSWEAALQSSALEVIEPTLFFRLAYLYSEIEGVGVRARVQFQFGEREILPSLEAEPDRFREESGQLATDLGPIRSFRSESGDRGGR